MDYQKRVRELEDEGCTTSDAQSIASVENRKSIKSELALAKSQHNQLVCYKYAHCNHIPTYYLTKINKEIMRLSELITLLDDNLRKAA